MRVHVFGPAFKHEAVDIAKPDVLALDAQFQQHVQAGDPRRAATGRDDLDAVECLASNMQRVGGRGADNDGGAVLVVVENRDVHPFAADLFDDEAVRGLDILKVDGPERRLHRADDFRELFRVRLVQFNVEAIDIGEFLEQDRLALHDRLGGKRADVAKTQNSGAVGHDRHKIAARGITCGGRGIGLDLEAGFGHPGRIGPAQVAPVGQRLGCAYLQFSGFRELVIIQRRLPCAVLPYLFHARLRKTGLVLN